MIYKSHSDTCEELLRLGDVLKYLLFITDGSKISQHLCTKSSMVSVPDCVSDVFVRKCSTQSLRNSYFVLPRFRTTRYGKHFVRYLGPFLWSKLNVNQRDSPSLAVFIKKKITKLNLLTNNSNCCNFCSQQNHFIVIIII